MTEFRLKCPECSHQFEEFTQLGVCPECGCGEPVLFAWINPAYKEKRK